MQHINDDIDEIFKNAADSYPLKISGADWESVEGRLHNVEGGQEHLPVLALSSPKTNKSYRYLLLLLLLPVGFFAAKYAGWTGSGDNTTSQLNKNVTPAGSQKKAEAPAANSNAVVNDNAGNKNANTATEKLTGKRAVEGNSNTSRKTTINQPATGNIAAAGINTSNVHVPGLADLRAIKEQQDRETITKPRVITVPESSAAVKNNPESGYTAEIKKDDGITGNGLQVKPDVSANQTSSNIAVIESKQGAGKSPPTDQPVKYKNPRSFYLGAFVAPDYTTVKYQPGNKVGFDYGGLIGYNFTDRISVELGVSTDKKYYTTDGKYYNSKQHWLANAGTLLTLSGYSSLTEFPLNFKYNFKAGKDGNFFASAGLISYVVHEENYDYEFDKSGFIYHKDKSTKISTTNMFANVNISAGYESSLGNFWNFRIEPYYRVPIKGIGLGSLPITSIGLNIGVTKKIKF